jgi:hypothetical protein
MTSHPGNYSVELAVRRTLMHADVFGVVGRQVAGSTVQTLMKAYTRLDKYLRRIRDVTPDGGSYITEGDVR